MRILRTLATIFSAVFLVAGCAGFDPGPPPLTSADIVHLSKSGEPPAAVVDKLKKTQTVLWLSASDILKLREAGVAREVLDYLQAAQMAELRRRNQFDLLLYGPEMSPFSRCGGFPPRGGRFTGFFAPFC